MTIDVMPAIETTYLLFAFPNMFISQLHPTKGSYSEKGRAMQEAEVSEAGVRFGVPRRKLLLSGPCASVFEFCLVGGVAHSVDTVQHSGHGHIVLNAIEQFRMARLQESVAPSTLYVEPLAVLGFRVCDAGDVVIAAGFVVEHIVDD